MSASKYGAVSLELKLTTGHRITVINSSTGVDYVLRVHRPTGGTRMTWGPEPVALLALGVELAGES